MWVAEVVADAGLMHPARLKRLSGSYLKPLQLVAQGMVTLATEAEKAVTVLTERWAAVQQAFADGSTSFGRHA